MRISRKVVMMSMKHLWKNLHWVAVKISMLGSKSFLIKTWEKSTMRNSRNRLSTTLSLTSHLKGKLINTCKTKKNRFIKKTISQLKMLLSPSSLLLKPLKA